MMTARRSALRLAVAGVVSLGIGIGVAGCSATATGPDGSTQIEVSLPDVSLPSVGGGSDSGGDSGSGGDAGSGGDSSGGDAGSGGDSSGGDASSGGDSGGGQDASSGGQDNGLGPLGWAVIIIGAIAVIALIMSGSSSASDRRAAEASRRERLLRRLNSVIQNARWASSQASQALTIENNRQLQAAWSQARSYMPDIETSAASIAAHEPDSDLASAVGAMGQAVAGLRGAMDTYANVRQHASIDDAAATSAEQNVRTAMSQLDHELQQVSDLSVARGN